MHLEQVSSTINIDIETLKMLNPQYTLSIIPATTKSYPLTLPAERISEYIENEAIIHSKDSAFLKEYVIHANIEKKRAQAPPAKYHTVKKGETLGAIARKYGRTVKQLMTWNGIKNANTLRIGQRLRVSAI
jgi:membrane-bound lytic murein transglycosylase D